VPPVSTLMKGCASAAGADINAITATAAARLEIPRIARPRFGREIGRRAACGQPIRPAKNNRVDK
jgi:hypothetical protein